MLCDADHHCFVPIIWENIYSEKRAIRFMCQYCTLLQTIDDINNRNKKIEEKHKQFG